MDVREKLVELLISTIGLTPMDAEIYANDFIARGVTVQRWIPVTERLPVEECERFTAENDDWDVYPCLATVQTRMRVRYVTKLFFTGQNFVDDEYVRYTEQVTHWMPLPPPPKGE